VLAGAPDGAIRRVQVMSDLVIEDARDLALAEDPYPSQLRMHLHNVPMQIAAERGIPALGVFVWFVVSLARALLKMFRHGEQSVLAATALASLVGMLAAGMFEYNFGDSEFQMLFLVLITPSFAAMRPESSRAV
jgi:O-antigen ligase